MCVCVCVKEREKEKEREREGGGGGEETHLLVVLYLVDAVVGEVEFL